MVVRFRVSYILSNKCDLKQQFLGPTYILYHMYVHCRVQICLENSISRCLNSGSPDNVYEESELGQIYIARKLLS